MFGDNGNYNFITFTERQRCELIFIDWKTINRYCTGSVTFTMNKIERLGEGSALV